MSVKKYIRQRMLEIYDCYGMDKDETYITIDMYFVRKGGEKQHKTLRFSRGEWEGVREFYSLADLREMDALEILFDHLPPVFRDEAKKLVLSQYEKKKQDDFFDLRKMADEIKQRGEKFDGYYGEV